VPVDKLLERLPHPRVLASIHDLLHRCLFKSIGEDTFRLHVLGYQFDFAIPTEGTRKLKE
jgi:hypothetical protein